MAHVLIVYATTHGHTLLIARHMAATAAGRGHRTTLVSIDEPPADLTPERFDAVIIGGSVHASQFSPKLLVFIRRHLRALAAMPTAFFSVGLAAASAREEDRAGARLCVRQFLDKAGWAPGMVGGFAGAIMYSRYGFLIRYIIRFIAGREGLSRDTSCDHVYTDWRDVERFTEEFLAPFDSVLHPGEASTEPAAGSAEGTVR